MRINKIIIIVFITITLSLFAMKSSPDASPSNSESNGSTSSCEMRTSPLRRNDISSSPLIARSTGNPFFLGDPREKRVRSQETIARANIQAAQLRELLRLVQGMNKAFE